MKHINLTQMLQGCSKRNGMTVSASNPDGEPTVNRQSRLMSLSGKKAEKEQLSPSCLLSASFPLSFRSRYLRYAAVIFCVLAMSVGQMWGATITWNTADNATNEDVNLTSNTGFTGDDGKTTLTYTNPSGCKRLKSNGGLYMNGTSQFNNSTKLRYLTFKAPSTTGTVSLTLAAINGKTNGTGSATIKIYGGTTVAYDVSTLNSSLTSPTIYALQTGTSDIIITFSAKCTIKEVKWTDVAEPSYTTIYANDFTATPMGTATVAYSSMAPMGSSVSSWIGWKQSYAKGVVSSSSNCSATLTFAIPLALNSDGNDKGRIRIYWGHSTNNKTLGLKVNGSSVSFSPTTVATTLYPTTLNVAEYTIPDATTNISSIAASGSSSTGTYLFRIEVLTHSAGGGCGSGTQAALTLSSSSGTICGTGTATFTVSGGSGTGALSVSSSDESKATASIDGTTVTVTGVAAGSATITVTKACDATYAEKTATYSATVAATPSAAAGVDKTTEPGTGVALAATAAADGCTGAWTIQSGPNTSTAQLSSTSSATATFTPTVAGTYTLRWTVTNTSSSCSAYDDMTVTAAVCSISDCGNATLTYPIYTSGDLSTSNLFSSATSSNATAVSVGSSPAFTGVTVSSATKGSSASAGACYAKSTALTGKMTYSASSKSSSYYIDFPFTVNTGYTFTPCDVQVVIQPVSSNQAFTVEITDGTNVYGTSTATLNAGVMEPIIGLTSTAEMSAGNYAVRLYPHGGSSKEFRMGANVILKGTTAAVASDSYDIHIGKNNADYTDESLTNTSGTTWSKTITLDASSYYEFKVKKTPSVGEAVWYGNNGKITATTSPAWDFSTGDGNCKLYTTVAGSYTFSWDTSNDKLTVTYPAGEHTTKRVYMVCGDSWCNDSPKFFVHSWGVSDYNTQVQQNACGEYYADIIWYNDYFQFTRNNSTATAYDNNQWNVSQDLTYNSSQTKWTCTGWSDSKGTFSSSAYSPTTYTISYNKGTNGTGSKANESKTCGVAFTLPGSTFTYAGHTQDGWATTDGGTIAYALSGSYTTNDDEEFFPHWKCNTPTITDNGDNTVTITVPSGTTVRYTTDGSTPTSSTGTVYSSPFSIVADCTVKAIAYQTGCTDSEVVSEDCTYHAAVTCTGDPTALVSGTLYKAQVMKSACFNTVDGDFVYGLSANDKFYITGTTNSDNSSTGTVEIKGQSKTIDAIDFDSIAWLKGEGSTTHRSIKFVTGGAGTLTVYGHTGKNAGNVQVKPSASSAVNVITASSSSSQDISGTYDVTAAGTYYILSNGSSAAVYGIKFVAAPSCSTPSAPTATSNGTTAATTQVVSWTDGSNDKWDVYVSTSSSTPAAGDTPTASGLTAKTYTFTGLTASTTYYWWVRSVCDDTHKSSWYAGSSFATSAAGEDPIPALISYYLQTPNSKTQPTSLSTDSIVTTPKRLKGDTLKNFVPVTLGSSLGITKAGKGDGGTWSAGIGNTPADSATAVTDAYAAKLAFDIHDDYELNISTITLNVKSVTNASQIYRVKVTDGENTVYGRVAPGKDSDNSVVFGSFSGIKFSGTVTLTLWVWSTAAAEYRLKSPIQIDGTLTRKATACTMPTQTFSTGAYTLGGDALNLSTLFNSNSSGAVTYSVVSASGTSATIVGSSFTASNTGTATIRATQAADGEGNYCAKSIETTITVSGDCTPQSLSKVVVTGGSAGTVTGYNGDEYAGSAVISVNGSTTDATNIDGESGNETGYKMTGSGTAIVFATLKKGTFLAGDQVRIGITRRNDTRQVDSKYNVLTIYYGTNKDDATALATINTSGDNDNGAAEHEGAGFYTYTLTAANVTTIGSKKGIGLFRDETDNGQNPFVHSLEILGCRDWTVCTAPNAVVAGSVTHNSAVLTVTDEEETGNYEFYYSTSNTAPTASTVALATGSALTKTITGLSASTTYYYWVRSNCGGVTKSAWVAGTPATFTTTAAPSTYSVTYSATDKTSGSVPEDASTYEEGDVVTVKGNTGSLAKTGSSFVGWNTASDGTGVFYPAGYKFYMGDANVTLHAVWGSVGATCVTLTNFETSSYAKSSNKPDSEGKYFYGYKGTVGADYAVTITTPATDVKGANSGANLLLTQNTRFSIYADNTTTGGTPATFSDVTAVSFKIKANKNTKIPTIDVYVGSTKIKTVTGGSESSDTDGHEYDTSDFTTITVSGLSNLAGIVKFENTSSGSSDYKAYFDDIQICYGSGASSGYTVSFDKNGHGSAIADIENVPSGSKIGAPVPAPTAADYDFLGWYREAGGTNAWNFGTMTITKDTTLYAKWGNCAPTITTHPVAANYNQNGVASALTVVAETNGGGDLHYQWWVKENDLAEEDGSAIPGETGNSFTPSTALLGTSYYYCVVSNDCGNVKTNTAEVTIRDTKPDPTAVWTVAEPKHGGKGFTFSVIAKNEDGTELWDGTLTEEMLSVSSEAVLGDVEVNNTTKTISGTYGVKASATSPVTFYLLLPATETLAAKRLDKDRSFEACAGGDGSTHDIRVLKANKNITFGGGTVYGWDNPGEGFLTASTGGTVSTAKAGTKMESVFDTVYNTNKKAFWVMPYAAGIKKIKVYGDVRVKELVVSNVRKVTSFTSGKDANNIAFSAAYEGGGDNVASTGYHWFEIILEDALDANDIIYFTVSENFQISGVRVTEGTSSGSLYTSLEWSNSQSDGATLVKREDDVDFEVTANRNDANALASLGTISYSSSNTTVATVNAATGQVTIADNIDFGSADYKTTTITATLAASGCYKRCVLTYELQVNKYICTEAVGTVSIKTDNACSGKELEVSGYEAGATIQWYKNGITIPGEIGTTYTATTEGTYYAVTHKNCDAVSNEITINFGAAAATKIVDSWYVKNGRRTPDIALVQTTNATGFTVTSSGTPVTSIGGCTFELKKDGIIYLHGTTPNGDAPSDMTPGDMTITITATACTPSTSLDIVLHIQAETTNPSVAFVVDGTLRKDGGTATSVLAAKTSDRPLWKYLENTFTLTGCNAYWSVDSKELRQYYSQFDAILITDDPSTSTNGTGGVSYVKAFGTMVDVRPILTMEAYVGKFKDGGWHVYNANPTSPDPRQVELKLECKNHDIFKGLNPATSDNVRTTTDEYGNEYWHVIMVDTTQSPYHNTTSNYEALPALQGFDPNKFDKMLGVGTIFEGKLQGGVERQEEPAARMMILGIQNNAMGALTNEGKLIVKNALEYLLMTNMEDVNDCSNYFVGGTDGHEREWHNSGNWTGGQLPDFETRARILAPVEISTVVRVAHIDIITDGESGKVDKPEGSVTVKPTGTLIVSGTINRAKAPYYGIDDLMPTTPSNLILETSNTSQSALIFDNSNGETQATVTVHSKANKDGSTRNWQYLTSPLQETPVTEFFYGVGTYTYKHSEADGGWVRYGLGTTFHAFDAIGLTQDNEKDFVFYGPLAPTGEWELSLTNDHSGNNLFGNSWTAPIDLKALVNNTDFDSNIDQDLAIYNTGSDRKNGSGEFDQEDADIRPGTWHHVPLQLATLEDAGWTGMKVIPAYQAFQLKATGAATLNIDYDKCVRGTESANYNEPLRAPRRPDARQAERDIEALRIAVSDANGIAYIYLLEGNQFTEGYDNGWELAYTANSKYGKLYAISPAQGNMMALARPSLEGTMVGFQPGESSEYTITFNETDGYYYLNDLKMEQSTLIQAGESYTFSVEEGESANRFLISSIPFNKPDIVTGVTNPDAEAPKVQKVIYNDKLYIIRGGRVFSADGQLIK